MYFVSVCVGGGGGGAKQRRETWNGGKRRELVCRDSWNVVSEETSFSHVIII